VDVGTYETTVEFSEAHNGFLEVFLQLGLIGAVLAFALLLQLWGSSVRPSDRPASANTTLQLTIIFQIVLALTAAVLLNRGSLLIFVLVLSFGIRNAISEPAVARGPRHRIGT
jgi:exopolysaccharide production protein ExoQ